MLHVGLHAHMVANAHAQEKIVNVGSAWPDMGMLARTHATCHAGVRSKELRALSVGRTAAILPRATVRHLYPLDCMWGYSS